MAVRVAIVGLGKIAHDQHIPAIAASDEFELVAAASLSGTIDGIPVFESVDALLGAGIAIDAIAMCQPPQARFAAAAKAIRAGKRSEEHTSELQSLMRISYAVFCLKTNKQ